MYGIGVMLMSCVLSLAGLLRMFQSVAGNK